MNTSPKTDAKAERIKYALAKKEKGNPDYVDWEFVVPMQFARVMEIRLSQAVEHLEWFMKNLAEGAKQFPSIQMSFPQAEQFVAEYREKNPKEPTPNPNNPKASREGEAEEVPAVHQGLIDAVPAFFAFQDALEKAFSKPKGGEANDPESNGQPVAAAPNVQPEGTRQEGEGRVTNLWNTDAPEGKTWKCPDCGSQATLGGNAAYHVATTNHAQPTLVDFTAPSEWDGCPNCGARRHEPQCWNCFYMPKSSEQLAKEYAAFKSRRPAPPEPTDGQGEATDSEKALGEAAECIKMILSNWPTSHDGGAYYSDPIPFGVKACRYWLKKHADLLGRSAIRAAMKGEGR